MSLTFKLFSLGIRTLAKPIGNYIKKQAKEHEGFRRFAIAHAQRVHRIDMRMRLGILHDPAAQERMHERERKAAEEKKKKEETPTVRTEKEQREYEQKKEREGKDPKEEPKKKEDSKVKIRPLSDARAIDLGANFFSEAFIFGVAVGLLLLENWRSRNKESNRRDVVAERFEAIEADLERLRKEHNLPDLEALNERIQRAKDERDSYSWYSPAGWWSRFGPSGATGSDDEAPGEVEESKPSQAPAEPSASPPDSSKQKTPSKPEPPAEAKHPEPPAKPSPAPLKERIDTT